MVERRLGCVDSESGRLLLFAAVNGCKKIARRQRPARLVARYRNVKDWGGIEPSPPRARQHSLPYAGHRRGVQARMAESNHRQIEGIESVRGRRSRPWPRYSAFRLHWFH